MARLRRFAERVANLLRPMGWLMAVNGGTSTAVNAPAGTLTLTADGTNQARADQMVQTFVGRSYTLTFTVSGAAPALRIGGTQGGSSVLSATQTVGDKVVTFTATSSLSWIRFDKTTVSAAVISAIILV